MKTPTLALPVVLCLILSLFAGCSAAPTPKRYVPVSCGARLQRDGIGGRFLNHLHRLDGRDHHLQELHQWRNGHRALYGQWRRNVHHHRSRGQSFGCVRSPGTMLMVEAKNAGPNRDTAALITAIENAPASINTFAGRSFNYLQFRTAAGGLELGTIAIDAQANIQHDGYWPYGALQQPQALFGGGSLPASSVQEDASGDFFTITESGGSSDIVFGTQTGFFAVDTGNGTILSLAKAASKTFATSNAGTYTAIYYEKVNAQTGQNNAETGTPLEGKATVAIGANGSLTIADSQGNTLAGGTLTAVADTSYLYDGTSNKLSDPCNGLFTFRTTANSQQDVFVSFQGNAVIFASFQTALPLANGATYTYYYGVGLK